MSNDFCIFCEIVAGRAGASVVYEDDRVLAFLDLFPIVEGHILVIPKAHAAYLADMDAEDGAQVFRVGQMLAQAVRDSGVRCEGVNLFLSDGAVAGQEVFHVHLHVLPRYTGDRFGLRIEGRGSPTREELAAIAERIRGVSPRR